MPKSYNEQSVKILNKIGSTEQGFSNSDTIYLCHLSFPLHSDFFLNYEPFRVAFYKTFPCYFILKDY